MDRIMLTEKQVPAGMYVNLFMPERDVPEEMDGKVMRFRAMVGGIPSRVKLYHMEDDVPIVGLEGFVEGARFSLEEVYSPQNAPVGKEYVVYLRGERMKATRDRDGGDLRLVRVKKTEDGKLLGSNGLLYQYWMAEVPLSDNAQLVSVSR